MKFFDRMSACQDAGPYKRMWKMAESLSEQGFDFIQTNKKLFFTDVPRVFLGRTGGRLGIHKFKSRYEKIRKHYKSSALALQVINGDQVDREDYKKYLRRKKYLGQAMIKTLAYKEKASVLQTLEENLKCSQLSDQF